MGIRKGEEGLCTGTGRAVCRQGWEVGGCSVTGVGVEACRHSLSLHHWSIDNSPPCRQEGQPYLGPGEGGRQSRCEGSLGRGLGVCWGRVRGALRTQSSIRLYPQTPHHAELLGRRPQREACILRSGGDPGGPASGQGSSGEPPLSLSCYSNLWLQPRDHHMDGQSPTLPMKSPRLVLREPTRSPVSQQNSDVFLYLPLCPSAPFTCL